jgi:hypothetical protein
MVLHQCTGHACVQIPTDGTLQEIADAHTRRVARAERNLARIVGEGEATVREIEVELAAVQAKLAAAVAAHEQRVAEHNGILTTYREEATAAARACVTFRSRVAADGIEDLDVRQVYELLQQLSTPVPLAILEKQEVSGVVL